MEEQAIQQRPPARRGNNDRCLPASGNPAGKLPGTRSRASMLVEALLDGRAEALAEKAIELAMAGNPLALRLCLERLLPV